MRIVVNIPDTAYEGIINASKIGGDWGNDLLSVLCKGVTYGTPIPKGCGRLIDADHALDVMRDEMCGTGYQARAMYVLKK